MNDLTAYDSWQSTEAQIFTDHLAFIFYMLLEFLFFLILTFLLDSIEKQCGQKVFLPSASSFSQTALHHTAGKTHIHTHACSRTHTHAHTKNTLVLSFYMEFVFCYRRWTSLRSQTYCSTCWAVWRFCVYMVNVCITPEKIIHSSWLTYRRKCWFPGQSYSVFHYTSSALSFYHCQAVQ